MTKLPPFMNDFITITERWIRKDGLISLFRKIEGGELEFVNAWPVSQAPIFIHDDNPAGPIEWIEQDHLVSHDFARLASPASTRPATRIKLEP